MKNGLLSSSTNAWGGSINCFHISWFGCFHIAKSGKTFFGTGGTPAQMSGALPDVSNYFDARRVSSLDADCLLLSNQAKLFQLLQLIQG